MTTTQTHKSGLWLVPYKIRLLLDAVKFEHSIFALPFAYLGMVLAADGLPTWGQFMWITLAMVAARTLAMSSNRLIDRHLDAMNPRTQGRALPRRLLLPAELLILALVSLGIFLTAAAMLNTLALVLAPVAAFVVVGYAYAKRFTWASHFILGWADAIAPAGGWIAVKGDISWEAVILATAVAFWVAGFDILYATQDIEFDRRLHLHSIPQKWGVVAAFRWARMMHLLTVAALLCVGIGLSLSWPFYFGLAVAASLLLYEHRIISPTDLSRLNVAFFAVNGYIAITVFLFALASMYV